MYDWGIYGALAIAALLPTAALALLVVRVLQGFRDAKRARRHLFRDLDRLFERVETTMSKLASLADTSTLQTSVANLRAAFARFAVLREAWAEATGFTSYIPRK